MKTLYQMGPKALTSRGKSVKIEVPERQGSPEGTGVSVQGALPE